MTSRLRARNPELGQKVASFTGMSNCPHLGQRTVRPSERADVALQTMPVRNADACSILGRPDACILSRPFYAAHRLTGEHHGAVSDDCAEISGRVPRVSVAYLDCPFGA